MYPSVVDAKLFLIQGHTSCAISVETRMYLILVKLSRIEEREEKKDTDNVLTFIKWNTSIYKRPQMCK